VAMIVRAIAAGLSFLVGGVTPWWSDPAPVSSRPRSLAGISSWAVYYGDAEAAGADLARFDLVVLDPARHPSLAAVKRHGSLVLMYVSLGEVNVNHPEYRSIAAAPWVLGPNSNWPDARYLDVRAPAYERWLLGRIVPGALGARVNGLFLDTADSALELERAEPERFRGASAALQHILRTLRRDHPRALLVLNSGLPLADRLVDLLDGVALESIWTDYDFGAKRYRPRESEDAARRAAELRRFSKLGLATLALEYAPPQDSAWVDSLIERARTHGFVPYVSTIGLDEVHAATLARRP